MIKKETIAELLEYRKTLCGEEPWFEKEYLNPILEALGDDEEEIKQFLRECNEEDLSYLCGIFEYIYEKFMNDDMYDFLDEMEIKAGLHS